MNEKENFPRADLNPAVTTLDGATFHPATPLEFFHMLREASRDPRDTYEDFLQATARAATLYNGAPHDGSTAEALARDLHASGLIVISDPQAFLP